MVVKNLKIVCLPTIFFLLILIFFYFFISFLGFRQDKKRTSVINETETTKWQVYYNPKYKYLLLYPPGWKIKDNELTGCIIKNGDCSLETDNIPCDEYSYIVLTVPLLGESPMNIQVLCNKQENPLLNFMKERGIYDERRCRLISINNLDGIICDNSTIGIVTDVDVYLSSSHLRKYVYSIYWMRGESSPLQDWDKEFFEILLKALPSNEVQPTSLYEAQLKVFQRILSSFQVVE